MSKTTVITATNALLTVPSDVTPRQQDPIPTLDLIRPFPERRECFSTTNPAATVQNILSVQLPVGYKSSASEEFMNPSQAEYFRRKLVRLRTDAQRELDATPPVGEADSLREGDQADQASAAVDRELDVVNRERAQALLQQIDRALVRLDNGSYGNGEDAGAPIGLRRLEAQPTATRTIEAEVKQGRQVPDAP